MDAVAAHPPGIIDVALFEDGVRAATLSHDGTVRLVDLRRDQIIGSLTVPGQGLGGETRVEFLKLNPVNQQLLVTTSRFGWIFALDTSHGLAQSWVLKPSENELAYLWPLHIALSQDGRRGLVWGQAPHRSQIVDLDTGAVLTSLSQFGCSMLGHDESNRQIVGFDSLGLCVIAEDGGSLRYRRLQGRNAGHLLVSASGFITGDPEVLEDVFVSDGASRASAIKLASSRFDPRAYKLE
jgi:WD40 repeat protein